MLEVVDLECRRGDRRLFSDLCFSLPSGTLLHVRGRNGSGKTTLLRALCGLLAREAGQICWRGEDIAALGEDYRRDMLYFGHLNGIKSDLNGIENLRVAATLDGDRIADDARGCGGRPHVTAGRARRFPGLGQTRTVRGPMAAGAKCRRRRHLALDGLRQWLLRCGPVAQLVRAHA